jgi:hypothetical protein
MSSQSGQWLHPGELLVDMKQHLKEALRRGICSTYVELFGWMMQMLPDDIRVVLMIVVKCCME